MNYTPPSGDIEIAFKTGYIPPAGDIEVNFYATSGDSVRISTRTEYQVTCKADYLHNAAKIAPQTECRVICKAKYFRVLGKTGMGAESQLKVAGGYTYQSGKVTSGAEYAVKCVASSSLATVALKTECRLITKAAYFATFVNTVARAEYSTIIKAEHRLTPAKMLGRIEYSLGCKAAYSKQSIVLQVNVNCSLRLKAKHFTFATAFTPLCYLTIKASVQPRANRGMQAGVEYALLVKAKKFENSAVIQGRVEYILTPKAGYNKIPALLHFSYQISPTVKGFWKVSRAGVRVRAECAVRCAAGVDHPPYFTSLPPKAATHPFLYRYEIEGRDREGQAYISPIILPAWLTYSGGVISGIPPDPLHASPSYYCMMQIVDSNGYFTVQEWGIKVLSVYENPPPNASMLRWLSQPYAGWLITVSMRGYNLTTHTEEEFYFASGEFRSSENDNPPHRPFLEYLLDIPVFESSVSVNFEGADATWGSLSLFNKDLNYLINNYAFDYRAITLKIGDPTWQYNDFYTLFSGTIGGTGLSVDGNKINIPLRNNTALLNKKLLDASVPSNIYPKFLSDGITPHPAAEQLIPEVWGGTHEHPVFNVKPVLIEPGQQTYQVHHGRIAEIVEVTDMGDKLTYNPDPTLSQYTVNLEEGTITLKNNGAKDVRCKVVGGQISQGNTWVQPNTAADLVKMLALRAGIDVSMILHSAFDQLNGSDPSVIGVVVTDETKIIDLVKPILNSVNAIHEFDPDGKLIVRKFVAPKAAYEKNGIYNPLYTVTSDDVDVHGVQIKEVIPPLKSYTLRYNHNHSVLSQVDDRIALEYPALQAELKQEWCETVALNTQNANVSAYLSAQSSDKINTLLIRKADAEFYAGVCMAYRAFPRLLVECEIISDKAAAFRCADHIAFALDNNEFNVNQKRFVISKVSREPLARKTTIQAVEIQSE